jgi:hypothetical protein
MEGRTYLLFCTGKSGAALIARQDPEATQNREGTDRP